MALTHISLVCVRETNTLAHDNAEFMHRMEKMLLCSRNNKTLTNKNTLFAIVMQMTFVLVIERTKMYDENDHGIGFYHETHDTYLECAGETEHTDGEKPTNGTKNRDGLAISCHL